MSEKNYYIVSREDNSILYCFGSVQKAQKCKVDLKSKNIDCYLKIVDVSDSSESILQKCLKLK